MIARGTVRLVRGSSRLIGLTGESNSLKRKSKIAAERLNLQNSLLISPVIIAGNLGVETGSMPGCTPPALHHHAGAGAGIAGFQLEPVARRLAAGLRIATATIFAPATA
jgi:hypothetical protein